MKLSYVYNFFQNCLVLSMNVWCSLVATTPSGSRPGPTALTLVASPANPSTNTLKIEFLHFYISTNNLEITVFSYLCILCTPLNQQGQTFCKIKFKILQTYIYNQHQKVKVSLYLYSVYEYHHNPIESQQWCCHLTVHYYSFGPFINQLFKL